MCGMLGFGGLGPGGPTVAMPQTPKCKAIIICDDVIEDKHSGKKSIIGAFNTLWANKFPASHPQAVLFLSLTDGQGEVDVSIRIVKDLQPNMSGQDIFKADGKVKFENPLDTAEMILRLHNLPLPSPGNYSFIVEVNGEMIGDRRVKVCKAEGLPRRESGRT